MIGIDLSGYEENILCPKNKKLIVLARSAKENSSFGGVKSVFRQMVWTSLTDENTYLL